MDVRSRPVVSVVTLSVLALAGPGAVRALAPDGLALPQGSAPVVLEPADFGGPIDNPFWPMTPGSRWVYRETEEEGVSREVTVTVTDRTKLILGIPAVEVHDVLTEDGVVGEDTRDWYAQDEAGNIWYMGEDTREYGEDGSISTEGSWLAGVDGAQPGIAIPGDPVVGLSYRQEYLRGEAEDAAAVLGLGEWAKVPAGSFRDLLLTHEYTPLEPDVLEYKLYARGVGQVLALDVSGGSAREELMSYQAGT